MNTIKNYSYKIEPIDEWYQLYKKYKPYIYRAVKTFPPEDREDLYSSIWDEIEKAKKSYKQEKGMCKRSWLFYYIRKTIAHFMKLKNKIQDHEKPIEETEEGLELSYSYYKDFDYDKTIDSKILSRDIALLINTIPEQYREIIKNHYGINTERKTLVQQSQLTGDDPKTIFDRLRRGLKYLRSRIQNNDKYKYIGEFLDYEA